ncbi:MAG TPA: L-glutamate gamma-semialdehyde dehydrogenase [Elusimicrobiales bacterium]|nr:L-glutamate gamma-semialdehyde dehydrogenase [Elusimicrobiales bacterium]HOL62729.1 L-glutamate gamma-semialdehyde dehydrogenase [Elusimicrobiales bacterium]HPO96072.1 L-glutamate gamma-semialdehyde dehydrogenase [Elusimicrobiales bacterium]
MNNTIFKMVQPENEPILSYAPNTPERKELKEKLKEMKSEVIEIPLIIGGKEIRTGKTADVIIPHENKKIIAKYHKASSKEVNLAIEEAMKARKEWAAMRWEERVKIFLKAAELLAGPYRQILNAATMLGQSKNPFQAEIDSACELIDFFRFNSYFASQIYSNQPSSPKPTLNYMDYRPLEGFVFAVTPFNFTSIAGNLPSSPAIMGNVVLWKPASTAVYSAYYIMKLWKEAGLPDGVINMVVGSGGEVGNPVLDSEYFAGLHFTGSTGVFNGMWSTAVKNLGKYKGYPRIVGETGGKDFVFAHSSCDRKVLITALIRGAFEYQGQKCSAASRAYIPKSVWNEIKEEMISEIKKIKMGTVEDFSNFMNAVIDKSSYENIKGYIDYAKKSSDAKIVVGGGCDDSVGYFIEPTVIVTENPQFKTMVEEIFGPVLTVYVYEDSKFEETLDLCDKTSPYGLTGSIMALDRKAIVKATEALVNAAGNFYINDKPTGAVVNQQPFGGARASGTNDKAGSWLNLIRWTSPRSIKENFVPPKDWKYPFMIEP